jgi:hypothetical protein
MTGDADVTRAVRSWLEDGRTTLPDRVLDAVLDQLPATPQQRSRWPGRVVRDAKPFAGLSVAAAALIVVVLAGVAVRPGATGVVAPGTSPTPSASSTPSPVASPSARLLPRFGALDAGTYVIPAGSLTPARLTLTVPPGWATDDGFITKGPPRPGSQDRGSFFNERVLLTTWRVTHVYSDVCRDRVLISAGTTADSIVAALASQTGRTVTGPTSTTLGDVAAQRLVMTLPMDIDPAGCDGGIIRFWPDPGPDENGGLCCSAPGSTDVVYVVDARTIQPLVVVARHQLDTTAADLAELNAVVSSIEVDVASATPPPEATFEPTPPPVPAP